MKQALYFTAPWCEPCKATKPYFLELVQEITKLEFYIIDVSETPKIANQYKVRSVPTLMMLDEDGDTIDRLVNPTSKEGMKAFIEGVM